MPIRALIVDDEELARRGLELRLANEPAAMPSTPSVA